MVETLIYIYLFICAGMIVFNIISIFVFREEDKNLNKRSLEFQKVVEEQIKRGSITEKEEKYLLRKLRKVNYLMAFDETLDRLNNDDPEKTRKYIESIYSIFRYLTFEYMKKNPVQTAYFPYLIRKHRIFNEKNSRSVSEALLELVSMDNLYCRENALQAMYSAGNAGIVAEALKIIDRSDSFYHSKMITDGLLNFTGDKGELCSRLWDEFDSFSTEMKTVVINYFRFSGLDESERVLYIMNNTEESDEVRYCCIRYFAKHNYAPALPFLYDFTAGDESSWEYIAISATALANYPCDRTTETLEKLVCNKNWYVRYNAAESLERLGADYDSLIEMFNGRDRYAAEMLQYRNDRKKLSEKEAVNV